MSDNRVEQFKLTPIIESYNVDEEYLYKDTFNFIKGYATGRNFSNTLKALPLARSLHDGQYRNGTVIVNDKRVKLPYVLHVLKVCSTLMMLNLPLSDFELDVLYASALLHDVLEDRKDMFPRGGYELVSQYGFPEDVYKVVKLVTKDHNASEEELDAYFNAIKVNKLAILVKIADRSHNVESLSVMKIDRLHRYVEETRTYIYLLCTYGQQNYSELSNGFAILKSKIVSLTEETEILTSMFTQQLFDKQDEIDVLRGRVEEQDRLIESLKAKIAELQAKSV